MPKISALTAAGGITSDDLLPIVNDPGGSPETQKATFSQLYAATKTLTNTTLTSPVLGGTPQYTGARGSIKSVVGEVQTSSTTTTTVASYTMTDETSCAFDVIVTCSRRTNVTKAGRWKRSVVYRRTSAGAPTIVGTLESGTDQETTAADDVTIDVSSNDVRVRVTAADADNRNWFCEMRVQETLAT